MKRIIPIFFVLLVVIAAGCIEEKTQLPTGIKSATFYVKGDEESYTLVYSNGTYTAFIGNATMYISQSSAYAIMKRGPLIKTAYFTFETPVISATELAEFFTSIRTTTVGTNVYMYVIDGSDTYTATLGKGPNKTIVMTSGKITVTAIINADAYVEKIPTTASKVLHIDPELVSVTTSIIGETHGTFVIPLEIYDFTANVSSPTFVLLSDTPRKMTLSVQESVDVVNSRAKFVTETFYGQSKVNWVTIEVNNNIATEVDGGTDTITYATELVPATFYDLFSIVTPIVWNNETYFMFYDTWGVYMLTIRDNTIYFAVVTGEGDLYTFATMVYRSALTTTTTI